MAVISSGIHAWDYFAREKSSHAVRRFRLSNLSYAVSCLTNNKFYLSVFHQQLVKLFDASQQKMHAALTEDDLTDILLEMHDLNITLNLADNKLLHIN